jgi:hypothetical protein
MVPISPKEYILTPYEFISDPHIKRKFRDRSLMVFLILDYLEYKSQFQKKVGLDGLSRMIVRKCGPSLPKKYVTQTVQLLEKLELITTNTNFYLELHADKFPTVCNRARESKELKNQKRIKKGEKNSVPKKVGSEKSKAKKSPPSDASLRFAEIWIQKNCGIFLAKKPSDYDKSKMGHQIDKLARLSRLPIPDIQKTMEMAWNDDFWRDKVASPEGLLKKSQSNGNRKIDNLYSSMHKKPMNKNTYEYDSGMSFEEEVEQWKKNWGRKDEDE